MNNPAKKYLAISLLIAPLFSYLLTVFVIHNYKNYYMSYEYPMWEHVKSVISSSDSRYTTLIVGDSRSKAGIIPSHLNEALQPAINLSLGGATPVEGYYSLKKYLANNRAPTNIVFSFAPFHLIEQDTYWLRTVKFDYLDFAEYREIEQTYADLGIENKSGHNNYFVYAINPLNYTTELLNGVNNNRSKINEVVSKNMVRDRGHFFFGRGKFSVGLNNETNFDAFKEDRLIDYYFNKMLDLAQVNKINIYWYTMPFNKSSCNRTRASFIKAYETYVNKTITQHGGRVLNNTPCWPNTYFGDPSHLYAGSRVASRLLSDSLTSK